MGLEHRGTAILLLETLRVVKFTQNEPSRLTLQSTWRTGKYVVKNKM